jgi:hypothetical protein
LPVIRPQSPMFLIGPPYVLPITESVDVMGSRKCLSRLTDIVLRHRVSTILPRSRAAMLLRRSFVGLHH